MTTEPDILTKLLVTAGLLLMAGIHLHILFRAFRKGKVSFWYWGAYDRETEQNGFWFCTAFNLACLAFFVWVLIVIALDVT
jgi:hypothetical protein